MGAFVVGSVLVNPHVYLYDVAVLAAPLVWLGGWIEGTSEEAPERRHQWRLAVYALYALLLVPTARIITIQFSPFVLSWFLYTVARAGVRPSVPAEEGAGQA
jgi:hypothetical protein